MRYYVRAGWRGWSRAWFALALLIGIGSALALAPLAAARRTDSAYRRFLRTAHAADVSTGMEVINDSHARFLDAVEQLPEVATFGRDAYLFVVPVDAAGDPVQVRVFGQPVATVDDRYLVSVDRARVLEGREAAAADEVTVSYQLERLTHVRIGQRFELGSYTAGNAERVLRGEPAPLDGPRMTVTVVGVDLVPGELAATTTDDTPVHFSSAFFRAYRDRIAYSESTYVRLRAGRADLPRFRSEVDALAAREGLQANSLDQGGQTTKVQRSIHLDAIALRVFAGLAGLVALLIVGQAIGRRVKFDAIDNATLRAIGMSRGNLVGVAVVRAGLAALVGVAIGAGLLVVVSPLAPVGLARVAEPHRGIDIDATVVGVGMLATVALAGGAAALAALGVLLTRGRRGSRPRARGLSRSFNVVSRRSPPAAATGIRFALDAGVGPDAAPVRSVLTSVTVAITALVAVVIFGASLDHLLATPRLYGFGWDALVGNPYARDVRDVVLVPLAGEPEVAMYSGGGFAPVTVDGAAVTALGFEDLRGHAGPAVLAGRAPEGADEITLGVKTMRRLHRQIGSVVVVTGPGGSRSFRVVGRAVFPAILPTDAAGVGEGAGLTLVGLRRVVPGAAENLFPFIARPGADRSRLIARLQSHFDPAEIQVSGPVTPTDIANYRSVHAVPLWLSAVLALFGAAALIHALVAGVGRRRRDLALLKTLGFVRRQIRTVVMWQASVTVAVGLVVGVPAGIVVGRAAWAAYANRQGVGVDVVVPIVDLAAIVVVAFVVGNVAAVLPARAAARVSPAAALRSG